MKLGKRICALALCIIALAGLVPVQADAADYIDPNRECRLNITYLGQNNAAMKNVQIDLYRVASVNKTMDYTLVGGFASYPIDLDNPGDAGWRALATTLQGYVAKDSVSAYDTGSTNLEGKISFPNRRGSLKPGLYLVLAKQQTSGGVTYSMTPTLVALPAYNSTGDNWSYNLEIFPKYEAISYTQRRVVKVWSDNNSTSRPTSVKVSLMKDNKLYESVVLNKDNSWRYTWRDLDPKYEWTMVEENVPFGYTVSVTRDSYTFYVTNTYSTNKSASGRGGTGTAQEVETLPQTGQLWWPVPVLAVLGMGFICCGEVLRRRRSHEK